MDSIGKFKPCAVRRRHGPGLVRAFGYALLLGGLLAWHGGTVARAGQAPATYVAEQAERALLAAYEAAEDDKQQKLETLIEQNKGLWADHALGVYPQYWLLELKLGGKNTPSAVDGEAAEFIRHHAGTVLANRLHQHWVTDLGLRAAASGDWRAFERERAHLGGNVRGEPMRCLDWLADYRRRQSAGLHDGKPVLVPGGARQMSLAALAREAKVFLAGTRQAASAACMQLTKALLDDNRLNVWEQVRVLVEWSQISRARDLLERVPESHRRVAKVALRSPAHWLRDLDKRVKRSGSASSVQRKVALLALARLSSSKPELAMRHAQALNLQFSPEERTLVWGRIGHMLALAHAPEALDAYRRAGVHVGELEGTSRAAEVLAWQVRTALRAEHGTDWAMVRQAIERMPLEMRKEPAWVYWYARALWSGEPSTQDAATAQRLMRSIAGEVHFYGLLAAEALGEPVRLPSSVGITPEAVNQFKHNAGLQRAFALYRLGLRAEGNREWWWQVNNARAGQGLDDVGLLALAQFAQEQGVWDRAIATSEQTQEVLDLYQRYPTPHREQLFEHAAAAGLDPTWVYGLIRQESRFIVDVRSSAGAAGLMQLMPKTARYVARRVGLADYSHQRITETDINMQLGTSYLRYLFDELDGSAVLSTAAYNAGPSRARRWRSLLARPVEGAIFVETIPYNETRGYVKHVLTNAVMYYAVLGDGHVPSLQARLGQIAPKRAVDSELP